MKLSDDIKSKIEDFALSAPACGVRDNNGELTQDQWAYDRVKFGVEFGIELGYHMAIDALASSEAHEFQREHGSFLNCARWTCWLKDRA